MSLYNILKYLRNAKGSLAKQAILNANVDNQLLKTFAKSVSDPAVNYYQSKIGPIDKSVVGQKEFDMQDIEFALTQLAKRKVTGTAAITALCERTSSLDDEGRELMAMLIKRSIGGGVGETMVLKAWPNLFFVPPYQRCAGMSPKVKEEYAAMPYFFVQTKYDGSFGYLHSAEAGATMFTRAGSFYSESLANRMAKSVPKGYVVMGEVLVFKEGVALSRKVSNGVLNSLLQSGDDTTEDIRMIAWDMVTDTDFADGRSYAPYEKRLYHMASGVGSSALSVADTVIVTSLEQAFAINREALLRGEEGTVWKKPDGIWRNSSSGTRDAVKVKIAFQAEYLVTGKYEGEGKAKGMLGGFNVTSSDGLISSNVGSGFSDAQRKEFWNENVNGWIVTLDANDVISRVNVDTESLFLPIFVERRTDKTEADSRQRVLYQLQAAKEVSR